jgi:hypothetical protein
LTLICGDPYNTSKVNLNCSASAIPSFFTRSRRFD